MNPYIIAQIINAQAMAQNFEYACQQAATQDDGKISKEEEHTLKKIHDATQQFIKQLNKIN